MKPLSDFVKTTLVGGFLVLFPIVVIAALLTHAVEVARGALHPIIARLPESLDLPGLPTLAVLSFCFATGLLVRTRLGRGASDFLERNLLERIPGYRLVRSLSQQAVGQAQGSQFAAALVEIEHGLVPAFIVEEHPDGRYTVFVPVSPTPAAGQIYILPAERVHPVAVSFAKAVGCVTRWGVGSGELLKAMQRPEERPARG